MLVELSLHQGALSMNLPTVECGPLFKTLIEASQVDVVEIRRKLYAESKKGILPEGDDIKPVPYLIRSNSQIQTDDGKLIPAGEVAVCIANAFSGIGTVVSLVFRDDSRRLFLNELFITPLSPLEVLALSLDC